MNTAEKNFTCVQWAEKKKTCYTEKKKYAYTCPEKKKFLVHERAKKKIHAYTKLHPPPLKSQMVHP